MFRVFTWVADTMKWNTQTCYQINRGEGYEPVWSCEGIGDIAYFYLEGVWFSAAVVVAMIFLIGCQLRCSSQQTNFRLIV